jgi:hypothetical protein
MVFSVMPSASASRASASSAWCHRFRGCPRSNATDKPHTNAQRRAIWTDGDEGESRRRGVLPDGPRLGPAARHHGAAPGAPEQGAGPGRCCRPGRCGQRRCAQYAQGCSGRPGVVPMALYKHVANKDELLDGMIDVLVAEITVPQRERRTATADVSWAGWGHRRSGSPCGHECGRSTRDGHCSLQPRPRCQAGRSPRKRAR